MPQEYYDVAARLFLALGAGALIGLERSYHARPAGFRTHILVCLASALLMQAAVTQGAWAMRLLPDENLVTDPTRMAHGVLTGIGFLCAGVIFRTGFSIHGLTTAASLWITAVLGILFGAGLYSIGVFGTVVTVLILVGLRLVSLKVPAKIVVDVEACWRRDAAPDDEIEAALRDVDANAVSDRFEMLDDGRTILRSWRIKAGGDAELKALASRLASVPALSVYKLRTCTSD